MGFFIFTEVMIFVLCYKPSLFYKTVVDEGLSFGNFMFYLISFLLEVCFLKLNLSYLLFHGSRQFHTTGKNDEKASQ